MRRILVLGLLIVGGCGAVPSLREQAKERCPTLSSMEFSTVWSGVEVFKDEGLSCDAAFLALSLSCAEANQPDPCRVCAKAIVAAVYGRNF